MFIKVTFNNRETYINVAHIEGFREHGQHTKIWLSDGDIIEFDDTICCEDYSYGETNEVTSCEECDVKNLAVFKIKEDLDMILKDYKYGGYLSKGSISELLYGLYEEDINLKEFLSDPTNFKIVGNVYENKDLLEVKER